MTRAGRLVLGVSGLIVGVLLALYGLFALLYRGDSGGGDTYVKFFGHEVDADLVGVVALVFAFVLLALAAVILRRGLSKRT